MGRWPTPTEAAAVLVDARNPRRVFAAGPGGLFRSVDAGRTWQQVKIPSVRRGLVALAQNPRLSQHLFAIAADGALLRSPDGGSTWRKVPQ